MSIKDFKISALETSKGLSLGEYKAVEKNQAMAGGKCGIGVGCSGGGGKCGMGRGCSGS